MEGIDQSARPRVLPRPSDGFDLSTVVTLGEEKIAQIILANGRRCGDCSLCCWLLDADQVPYKAKGEYCTKCRPGAGGCTIHATRPQQCRDYACLWLVNARLPDYWYPLKSHMFMDYNLPTGEQTPTFRIHVHPDYPNIWREDPYFRDILLMAKMARDRAVIIVNGDWQHMILTDGSIFSRELELPKPDPERARLAMEALKATAARITEEAKAKRDGSIPNRS